MAQPDPPFVRDFLSWVNRAREYAILEPSGHDRRAFVPMQKVQDYLEEDGLRRLIKILDTVFSPETPPLYAENIFPKYMAVFCILLHIGKGRYIREFTEHESLCDNRLPFDIENPPAKFPPSTEDPSLFSRFCEEQWRWCTPVFQRLMLNESFEAKRVLPITFMEDLGDGSSAKLYRIKIHKAFNNLRQEETKDRLSEEEADVFVLKKYKTEEAKKHFDSEVAAFQKLPPTSSIVEFYGSYIHGDSFNILLEFADKGTLAQYFRSETPPMTGEEIIKFWGSIFMLGQALAAIHQVKPRFPTLGTATLQGWHQDIKPDNILVVSNGVHCPYEWQFKLGDLGLSHFNSVVGIPGDDNTATAAHGTKTYGAPECYREDTFAEQSDLRVSQSVDIWSLGCVYSEVARWVVSGEKGLDDYRKERKFETGAIPGFKNADCFHNGERALKAVHKCHERIIASVRWQDCITSSAIDVIIKPMLEVSDGRPTAMPVWRSSQRTIEDAKARLSKFLEAHTYSSGKPGPPLPRVLPPTLQGGTRLWTQANNYFEGEYGRSPDDISPNEADVNGEFFDIYSMDDNETSEQNQSLTRKKPTDEIGSASRGSFMATKPSTNKSTKLPDRPKLATNLSTLENGNPPEQSYEPRSASDSAVPGLHPSSIPRGHSPINGGQHRRDASNSSSFYPGSPQTASHTTLAEAVKQTPPVWLMDDAVKWRNERKNGRNIPVPHPDLLGRLRKRDHVFLIDDSASMKEHWDIVCNVLDVLAYIVKDLESQRVELYFTISTQTKTATTTMALLELLYGKSHEGCTDINIRLNEIIDKYKTKLEHIPSKILSIVKKEQSIRPLNLYILTDGVWETQSKPDNLIINLVQKLIKHDKARQQVGIQFISFGSHSVGLERMRKLDSELRGDRKEEEWLNIVDTTPSNGNVWKMLLGAINDTFDEDEFTGDGKRHNSTSAGSAALSPRKSDDI